MSESQYARKAMEEVIRLADEKMISVQEYLIKRNEDFNHFTRGCDDTAKELNAYFNNLTKQLEKWKMTFMQDILENSKKRELDFSKQRSGLEEQTRVLRDLRERTGRSVALGASSGGTDLVYQVHNCIFNINQEIEHVDNFMGNCLPLKFVGKFQVDRLPKEDIGCLEQLVDLAGAEILPIKLPKIKLGQLFHLAFKLSDKHCEAARKFLTFGITKDDQKDQKVGAYLQDNKDGAYTLSFPITAIVPHTVHIRYMGQHIRNSPYTILFKIGSHTGVSGAHSMGDHKESHNHLTALGHNNDSNNTSFEDVVEIPRPGAGTSQSISFRDLKTILQKDRNCNNLKTSSPIKMPDYNQEPFRDMPDSNVSNSSSRPFVSALSPTSSVRSSSPLIPPSSFKAPCETTGDSIKENMPPVDLISIKKEEICLADGITDMHIMEEKCIPPPLKKLLDHLQTIPNKPISAEFVGIISNHFKFPIGVTCSQNLDYFFVCDTGNNLIKVFDSLLAPCATFGSKDGLHRPSAVVLKPNCPTADLYVKDDYAVRLYRATGSNSLDWSEHASSVSKTGRPSRNRLYGMVWSPNGRLVTLDETSEVLCHVDPDTVTFADSFLYCPLKMLGALRKKSKCRFIESSPTNDCLFCSDLGLSVVYATTFEGVFLRQFGGEGRDFGMLKEPSGLSAIGDDFLMVGDSKNNRVQIFNSDGKFQCYVNLSEKIIRPSDILLCPDQSTLLIMNYIHHLIKVYKF